MVEKNQGVSPEPEEASYHSQINMWAKHFSEESENGGLPVKYIRNPEDLTHLTAFFAWAAWAAAADCPGHSYSYTSNFPYDPMAGNLPPHVALLWSALSLIALLFLAQVLVGGATAHYRAEPTSVKQMRGETS